MNGVSETEREVERIQKMELFSERKENGVGVGNGGRRGMLVGVGCRLLKDKGNDDLC